MTSLFPKMQSEQKKSKKTKSISDPVFLFIPTHLCRYFKQLLM